MNEILKAAKALGDRNRLLALKALEGRELCVCEIIALLRLAPSTVSKHMSILADAQLVLGRKQGKWMHYRLNRSARTRALLNWALSGLDDSPEAAKNAARVDAVIERFRNCRSQNRQQTDRKGKK